MRKPAFSRIVLSVRRLPLFSVLTALALLWLGGGGVHAQNGVVDYTTPLCGNTPQSAGSDLTYDTNSDALWILDQGSGQVCRYVLSAFPPDILFTTSVNHPFGAAAPPFFSPLCSGVAFRNSTSTLFILNSSTLEIVEMDLNGAQIGLPIALSPPLPDAALSGLAYDTVTGNLWCRDIVNDLAIQCDPVTGATISQIELPGEVIMYGSGLSFIEFGGIRYLEFTRGHVLDFAPAKTIRVDIITGSAVCTEVNLTQIPDPVLGVVRPPSGTVIYATTAGDVYKIDSSQNSVQAPTDLRCFNDVTGEVNINWRNCGPGAGGLYSSLRVLRDGAVIQLLAGNATSFTDIDPLPLGSNLTYTVQGVVGSSTAGAACNVQTGAGGLVGYQAFAGNRPYDLALDPLSGELYVTDNFSDQIFVYDTNLNLVRILATTLNNLQGIAFNTLTGELIVSQSPNISNLLTFVDPLTGGLSGSAIPTSPSTDVSAITYDSNQDDYLYVDASSNPVVVVRVDATAPTAGAVLGTFSPPGVSGLLLGRGICHLEASDTLLCPVQQSSSGGNLTSVSEFFVNGFPTGFGFPINAIGASLAVSNSIRGVEDLANVIFMAGDATNAIFRMLVASGGSFFVRGEANGDGITDLADVIFIADYLFQSGSAPACADAVDVNDSGDLDISDPLYLLLYMFGGGPPPPAPYPSPGPDPTFLDPLGC